MGINASILIVDDTPANLKVLISALREYGYSIRPVSNGATALRAARAEVPDLILLDVRMPEMDGFQVCEEFKADPDLMHVPVLFMSAASEDVDPEEMLAIGAVDFIEKPFQLDIVLEKIARYLVD